jgi:hypothetical protein
VDSSPNIFIFQKSYQHKSDGKTEFLASTFFLGEFCAMFLTDCKSESSFAFFDTF